MSSEPRVGVIGGSGFYSLTGEKEPREEAVETPFSREPVTVFKESVAGRDVCFIPRHGQDHSIPPHKINYRANLWALKQCGVEKIIAANAAGGIIPNMRPGRLVVPHQLIDYTWGRKHTFFEGLDALAGHVDFTHPYADELRAALIHACGELGLDVEPSGVYACTQGPRLETAAEVRKLKADGCHIVGMTGMPEAALARELEIDYAALALVVNWAAGVTGEPISLEQIRQGLDRGAEAMRKVISMALPDD